VRKIIINIIRVIIFNILFAMKKVSLLLVIILTLVSSETIAQYRINKTKYDHRNYSFQPGDPYKPSSAVVASVIIPGLGQMTCGEAGRGFGFLLGWGGSLTCSFAGLLTINTTESDPKFEEKQARGSIMFLSGLIGAAVFWIWSFTDASKVAKVNNMAFRDKRGLSDNIIIQPYVDLHPVPSNSGMQIGLYARINF
jgi:hypothetical protein